MLCLVSFFIDISTEMVYPLIPIYLSLAFGAKPSLIGIIEGIAESLASLLKVGGGYLSDKYNRKKPMAFFGYSTAIVYKLALLLSASWAGVLAARVIDRFGKGIRTAPRDVLVSENAKDGRQGTAFGLHKTLDMAGSAVGILLSYFLMRNSSGEFAFKRVFALSIIPAIIGLIILGFVKEKRIPAEPKKAENFLKSFKNLDIRLKQFLIVAFVFNLSNSSNTFLLLRAQNVGYSATSVILLYFLFNLTSSLLALPFGRLSDKIGRRSLLVAGYIAFGIVYLGFAVCTSHAAMVVLFAAYGVYIALTAGIERAFLAEISPKELKGTVLGLHSSLVGIALLPASVVAGFLWDTVSPSAPFYLAGVLAFASAAAILFILRTDKGKRLHE